VTDRVRQQVSHELTQAHRVDDRLRVGVAVGLQPDAGRLGGAPVRVHRLREGVSHERRLGMDAQRARIGGGQVTEH
jgi:hypothetical protein